MLAHDTDAYNRLLQTERIVIEVGITQKQQTTVHKGFLAYHSSYFAGQLSKSGMLENNDGKIQLPNVTAATVKLFARWCYKGRLEYPYEGQKVSMNVLNQRKDLLMDVWFFSDMYGVPKLQNQAMLELARILGARPSLLSLNDVRSAVDNSAKHDYNALAQLCLIVLVAALDADNAKQSTDDYDHFGQQFVGFTRNIYIALGMYLKYTPQIKKPAKKSKLQLFLAEQAEGLQVVEVGPPEWVLSLCGAKPKPVVKPFEPGEVIEID